MAEEIKTEVRKCEWCEKPLDDCTCNDPWDYYDSSDYDDPDDRGMEFASDEF